MLGSNFELNSGIIVRIFSGRYSLSRCGAGQEQFILKTSLQPLSRERELSYKTP